MKRIFTIAFFAVAAVAANAVTLDGNSTENKKSEPSNVVRELTLKVGKGNNRYFYNVMTGERSEARKPAELPAGTVWLGIGSHHNENQKGLCPSAQIQNVCSPFSMKFANLSAGDITLIETFLESGKRISKENLPNLRIFKQKLAPVCRHYYSGELYEKYNKGREGANIGGYTLIALKGNDDTSSEFNSNVLAYGIMKIEDITKDGLTSADEGYEKQLTESVWKVKVWFPDNLLELIGE